MLTATGVPALVPFGVTPRQRDCVGAAAPLRQLCHGGCLAQLAPRLDAHPPPGQHLSIWITPSGLSWCCVGTDVASSGYNFGGPLSTAMMADARWGRVCCEILLGCPLLRRLHLRVW